MEKNDASIPQKKSRLTVAASPFNEIKFAVGVCFLLGLLLLSLLWIMKIDLVKQLTILITYSVVVTVYCFRRIGGLLKQLQRERYGALKK